MRRRKIDVENLGENIQISLKLPKKVLGWIEEACNENPTFTGRSHFIDNACRYYLSLVPCPSCSKLNPRDANVCCYCKTPLQGMQNVLEEIQSLVTEYEEVHATGLEIADTITNLQLDINDFIRSLDTKTRQIIEGEVDDFARRCYSRWAFSVGYFFEYRDLSKSYKGFKFTRSAHDLELTIPEYPTALTRFSEKLDSEGDGIKTLSTTEGAVKSSVLTGLYYYHIGKKILNGDNFSLKEIDNLLEGFKWSIRSALQYADSLKESYDDLMVYRKMIQLLSERQH